MLLCTAIAVSAASTSDPGWWRLYFSRLGMMGDLSSEFFNGGLVLSGVIIAGSAIPLRIALSATAALDGRMRMLLSLAVVGLGASLSGIGVFPLSADPLAHERATNGVVLSFACLLIMHRIGLWRTSRMLRIATTIAAPSILTGMGLLIAGWISLTVFEMLAFSVILGWVHLFERVAGRRRRNDGILREDAAGSELHGAPGSEQRASTPTGARRPGSCPLPVWSTDSGVMRLSDMWGMTRAPSPAAFLEP